MIRRVAAATTVGLTSLILVACGAAKPALSNAASGQLSAQVAAIRTAAQRQDSLGAQQGLAQLRTMLSGLEQHGQVSATRAADILSAALAVQAQLVVITTTTTTTTTTPPAPPDHHGKKGPAGNGGGGD